MQAQADTQPQKTSVTFTIPSWILAAVRVVDWGAKRVVDTAQKAGESVFKKPKFNLSTSKDKVLKSLNNFTPLILRNKKVSIFVLLVIAGAIVFAGIAKARQNSVAQAQVGAETASSAPTVFVNKNFRVAIKNSDGKPTGEDLLVTITTI